MNMQDLNTATPDATALMGGIIEDVQHLVKQQIAITRQEIVEDVSKAKDATKLYVAGVGVSLVGTVSLCFAIVHLLHWVTSPAGTDVAAFPLWACHATVGAGMALIGAILVWSGEIKWNTINPLHNPAADELKRNVELGLHAK